MSGDDLERVVSHAIARLPQPTAPASLLPRVMTAVHGQRLTGWRAWSPAWRVAAAVLLAAAVWSALSFGPALQEVIAARWIQTPDPAATDVMAWLDRAVETTSRAEAMLAVVGVLWRVILGPIAAYAVVLVLLLCLLFAALEASLTWRSRRAHST